MNRLSELLNLAKKYLFKFINSLDAKTVNTIKQGFFFLLFLLCIFGIIAGFRAGKKSAVISSPPIAEYVNDVFRIDMSRENSAGAFSSLLSSSLRKELQRKQHTVPEKKFEASRFESEPIKIPAEPETPDSGLAEIQEEQRPYMDNIPIITEGGEDPAPAVQENNKSREKSGPQPIDIFRGQVEN